MHENGVKETAKRTAKQLGWFVALWAAGVAVVTVVAFAIRTAIL